MRKAAEPGMVERIASFLSDNPLTHSWRDSVGGAINWGERQVMGDEDLRQMIGSGVKSKTVNGAITDEQVALLEELKGAPVDRQRLQQLATEYEGGVDGYVGGLATGYAQDAGMSRDQMKAVVARLQGPLNQHGELAHMLALGATHPVMAYSAVTAGGALGTAAGLKAYDWWLAQQQQSQKDAQLPLEPEQSGLM
jgi:hypothetical protein